MIAARYNHESVGRETNDELSLARLQYIHTRQHINTKNIYQRPVKYFLCHDAHEHD